jgi:agmatine deiminase
MIADHQTDTVFVSALLTAKHPQIESDLRAALGNRLRVIGGTKDIWCRDFMPIQLSGDRFLQFRYEPDYLKNAPQLRTPNGANLIDAPICTRSNLVIDGGNIVRWHDAAITTDKIYRENPGVEQSRLRNRLRALLEVDRLIVIPKEPYDKIGHADGMVRFVNDKTVLVNDYDKVDPAFDKRLRRALAGFEIVPFPYCPTGEVIDGIASAEGVYINYLQVRGTILLPTFSKQHDDGAASMLARAFQDSRIIPVNCNELAKNGGLLNCVTWNIELWT